MSKVVLGVVAGSMLAVSGVANAGVVGEQVGVSVTVFTATAGAFLNPSAGDAILHSIGGPATTLVGIAGLFEDVLVTSSVSDVANTRTITLQFLTANGATLGAPGLTLGGAALTTLAFNVGSINALSNGIDDPDRIGTVTGSLSLLGVAFTTAAGITQTPTTFSATNSISAGGADILSLGITGARYTFSYAIPTPGAAALMGLGGLAAARRRR